MKNCCSRAVHMVFFYTFFMTSKSGDMYYLLFVEGVSPDAEWITVVPLPGPLACLLLPIVTIGSTNTLK